MNTLPPSNDPLDLAPLPAGAWLDPALQMNTPLDPASDALLAPARWAGILMFVLGGLMLLLALIFFALGYSAPRFMADPQMADVSQILHKWEEQTHGKVAPAMIACSVIVGALAVAYLVLASFVLRGAQFAIIFSGLLSGGILILLLVPLAAGQQEPAGVTILMSLPFAVLLTLLWKALGNTARLRQTRAEWERRRWSTLDQQQAQAPGFMAYYEPPKPSTPARPRT